MGIEVRHKGMGIVSQHAKRRRKVAANNGRQDRLLGNSFVVLEIFDFGPCELISHRN
jgi:hypothetical protein